MDMRELKMFVRRFALVYFALGLFFLPLDVWLWWSESPRAASAFLATAFLFLGAAVAARLADNMTDHIE